MTQAAANKIYQCPALGVQPPSSPEAVFFPIAQLPVYIRPLTPTENADLDRFASEVAKAHDHFRLFRIFTSNYQELIRTVSHSFKIGIMEDSEKLEFDRLLLNLLASGTAIRDHFVKYFSSKFGKTEHADELRGFLDRLRAGSWAFAFMEDVRDYIQHQGLPIVFYDRSFSATSIKLKMTVDATKLSEDKRAWKYSKLSATKGTFDFFELIQEYYLRTKRDLANFLAKWFVPDLVPAHEFFSQLTKEAKEKVPTGRTIILMTFETIGHKHNFSFVPYPEDVFRELGLSPPT
jgi:hypothetical protein